MKQTIVLFLALICLADNVTAQTAADKNADSKEARQWFKKKEWLGGVKLKPSKTINTEEFYRQYHANKRYWDEAFSFLKSHDLKGLHKGKYEIDGDNVYATVTEGPTRNFEQTQYESHQKYVDFHCVIDGKELIGVNPVATSIVTNIYDEHKDIANYTGDGKLYKATPGTFFLFFPTDAHRPNITPGGNKVDKKLVIKIRASN